MGHKVSNIHGRLTAMCRNSGSLCGADRLPRRYPANGSSKAALTTCIAWSGPLSRSANRTMLTMLPRAIFCRSSSG